MDDSIEHREESESADEEAAEGLRLAVDVGRGARGQKARAHSGPDSHPRGQYRTLMLLGHLYTRSSLLRSASAFHDAQIIWIHFDISHASSASHGQADIKALQGRNGGEYDERLGR